jgi:hypothetical protein
MKSKRILAIFMVSLLAVVMVSCKKDGGSSSSSAYGASSNPSLANADKSAQYYWQKAQESESPEREANMLLTANALLKARKVSQAQQVLDEVKGYQFTGSMLSFKYLVEGRYQLATHNPRTALARLNNAKTSDLTPPLLAEYHEIKAQAFLEADQPINSVTERLKLSSLLRSKDAATYNNEQIWQTLQHVPVNELQRYANGTSNQTLKGWLELAIIERNINEGSPQYVAELQTWQGAYQNHPAEYLMPSSVSRAEVSSMQPKHIALLLPLEGSLGNSADAVRDGFLAAYYLDQQKTGRQPKVTVIDTKNDTQVEQAYQRAINGGADLIVGPLTKGGVEQIRQVASGSTPILALNYSDRGGSKGFYQFGLSPEDEARQAATKAWQDGYLNAIVITQEGEWGERVSHAFEQQWKAQGGRVLNQITFRPGNELAGSIKSALNIDQSEARAQQLVEQINVPLNFDARRRQDVDVIFLAAMPREARQIPPLLAFYYAKDVPIYATSSVYSGTPNPGLDKDLNGVTFCDIPWNLDARPQSGNTRDAIAQLWPSQAQSQQRLYALGVDAYEVIPLIPRLEALPDFAMSGATGKLYLDRNGKVTRVLRCTRFSEGAPKRLQSSL